MNSPLPLFSATEVKYFFSILFHENMGTNADIMELLKNKFPDLELDNELYKPKHNPLLGYYAKQMGEDEGKLHRFFCYAKNTKTRDYLVPCKKIALELERDYFKPFRCLNIDPGYVAKEQMVLSSHKPFAHRIFLDHGIYGELEYLYQNQEWQELPWTYPDYRDMEKKQYFMAIRRSLL
jgi:hypothetical protein